MILVYSVILLIGAHDTYARRTFLFGNETFSVMHAITMTASGTLRRDSFRPSMSGKF
jgi:hypothetical protein